MTRIDSVRAATDSAKDSVLHAAEVVAPYADTARDKAVHYAHEARVRIAPKVSLAADQARVQYDAHLAPRIVQARKQARSHVPTKVDEAAGRTAKVARQAAAVAGPRIEQAVAVSRPRIEQAVAVAGPARQEAVSRSSATLAALRGQVSAKDVQRIVRRRERRAMAGRMAKGALLLGALAGGAFAVWKWWDKQANPDWLVEPPAATEVSEESRLSSVDGSVGRSLDPDVAARQTESESAERVARERRQGK
ncbi:hypothetical protein GCM10018793_04210 [Streptomyces sulfonofaciens]|uniref:Uncharacterized protein n=1 Tax=Streptomyces sulfonofaciens TaxID=68272 RepID=A0A919FR15_9ACTN|nr:DUF5324 family protein [Streptomyces sulfonofaciens]GHH70334.1 hypothetical protein GCM10018793_04210 [Streptomyces sulfonofaciens]